MTRGVQGHRKKRLDGHRRAMAWAMEYQERQARRAEVRTARLEAENALLDQTNGQSAHAGAASAEPGESRGSSAGPRSGVN